MTPAFQTSKHQHRLCIQRTNWLINNSWNLEFLNCIYFNIMQTNRLKRFQLKLSAPNMHYKCRNELFSTQIITFTHNTIWVTHSNYILFFFLSFVSSTRFDIMDCHHKCRLKVIELWKPVQHRAGALRDWATEGDATKTALFRSCVYHQTCCDSRVVSLKPTNKMCLLSTLAKQKTGVSTLFQGLSLFQANQDD